AGSFSPHQTYNSTARTPAGGHTSSLHTPASSKGNRTVTSFLSSLPTLLRFPVGLRSGEGVRGALSNISDGTGRVAGASRRYGSDSNRGVSFLTSSDTDDD